MERTDRTTFLASLGAFVAAGFAVGSTSLRGIFRLSPPPPPPPPTAQPIQTTPPAHSVKRRG